jgi:hypothetical protein
MMSYLPYCPLQQMLLPQALQEWLPEPHSEAIMDQHLQAGAAPAAEEVGVMRMRLTEHAHDLREQRDHAESVLRTPPPSVTTGTPLRATPPSSCTSGDFTSRHGQVRRFTGEVLHRVRHTAATTPCTLKNINERKLLQGR